MDKLRKYIALFLCLIPAITYVKCDGQIAIMEKPSSMKLSLEKDMHTSDLLDTLEQIIGFQNDGKKLMEMMNVFQHKGLNVVIMRVSDDEFERHSSNAIKTYQLKEDIPFEEFLLELKKHDGQENIFGMNPRYNDIKTIKSIDANDKTPRLISANLASMEEPEIMKTMADLTKAMAGSQNILKILISSDGKVSEPYDRKKRQTPPAADEASDKKKEVVNAKSLNLAEDYDENFPVIFNIMLWFSIALIFALISICMVIAGMDPGRDSIIYRMTSTRMKKDN